MSCLAFAILLPALLGVLLFGGWTLYKNLAGDKRGNSVQEGPIEESWRTSAGDSGNFASVSEPEGLVPVESEPVSIDPGLPVSTQSKSRGRCTVAVLPFSVGNLQESTDVTGDYGDMSISRSMVETEFTNQLTSFLTKSRKFHLLERQAMRKVIDENKLTESDWAMPGQREKIGKLLVADYLVVGAIDRCSFEPKVTEIRITGERAVNWICSFKFSFRLIEVMTGKVVYSDTIVETVKSRDIRRDVDPEEWRDWTLSNYRDILFMRAAERSGNGILETIFPIRISSIKDGQVVLNRGDGAGISIGKMYRVCRPGAEIIDPDTGESLGLEDVAVGTVEVTAVESRFSKGNIVSGRDIEVGDVCRVIPARTGARSEEPEVMRPNW
jgi:hypothetical protein